MEADWSVALASSDPVITVPWAASGDEPECRFVDLRIDPDLIDEIEEARWETGVAVRIASAERRRFAALDCEVRCMDQQPRTWRRSFRSV